MIKTIYSIRDRVALIYRDIISDGPNDEAAKRNLAFAVNNDSQFAFMAKDFEFCKVGTFDTDTGKITPVFPVEVVCHVGDLIAHE